MQKANFIVMKNNNFVVIIGYNHIYIYSSNTIISHPHHPIRNMYSSEKIKMSEIHRTMI